MLRKLWRAVKGIPPGSVLADRDSGELLAAERDRGWLTLAVTKLAPPDSTTRVARYALGRWAAPDRPPLYRHLAALDDPPPSRFRWRQQAALAEFNARTGAMAVSTEELARPAGPGVARRGRQPVRPSWLLRGPAWRHRHVDLCWGCWKRFSDTEPGSIPIADQRFPRLCRCPGGPQARSHTNCRASGPYCPSCAARVSAEQRELDEHEADWY